MKQTRPLPEKFGRCSDCDAVILPGHMVMLLAVFVMAKDFRGPDNMRHRCEDCNEEGKWETQFEGRYKEMWTPVTMTVTSRSEDAPEDL